MNVKVTYNLSQAGQKAALMAGRVATQNVTETLSFDDPALIARLTINPDGTMVLNAEGRKVYGDKTLYFDAPPADLKELLAGLWWRTEANREMHAAVAREAEEREVARKAEEQAKAEHDAPLVEAILAEFEGLALDAPLPATINPGSDQGRRETGGIEMSARKGVRVGDLVDGAGMNDPVLHCRKCGADASANRGDYFWTGPEEVFRCCGVAMTLVKRRTVYEGVGR